MWEYLTKAIDENYKLKINTHLLNLGYYKMAFEGRWRKVFEHILEKFYKAVSKRDFRYGEQGIKMFILAYLNLTTLFKISSEAELNDGYSDIFMQADFMVSKEIKYSYIIELKYLKANNINTKPKKENNTKKAVEEAKEQLQKYSKYENTETKKIILVVSAKEALYLNEI
jgi:hypothetical protein